MDLRITTVQSQLTRHGDRDFANTCVIDSEIVICRVKRIVSRMSDNEELGPITLQRRNSQFRIIGVRAAVGSVYGICCVIGRRSLQEVCLEFGFAILFAYYQTVFGDDCTVVV